ncbi:MAG: carbamoyltransferase N-terminal domain-containing protein, partial [Candidatus Acidiferrales bacterium]
MKILGISGLENSVPFKRAHWPALDPREYRISQGHDAAAALLIDGRLVAAAAQERFNRKKHAADFPVDAIEYCLSAAGIEIEDVDEIAHGFDYLPYREIYSLDPVSSQLYREVLSKDALMIQLRRYFPTFPPERVHSVGHHLAHAASAAYT